MSAYINFKPTSIDDIVLPARHRKAFNKMIAKGEIQPMLFYGKPGCGKSLTASLLSKNVDIFRCDGIDSGPELIEKIYRTASALNLFHIESRRLIILDEIDKLTKPMQEKMRAVIDRFSNISDFVATTNNHDDVIGALKSRMTPVDFSSESFEAELKESWRETLSKTYQHHKKRKCSEKRLNEALSQFPDGRQMVQVLFNGTI